MIAARSIQTRRGFGRNAIDLPVAALAGLAAAFLAFAIPADLLGRLVAATGLPHMVAAAEPPLGLKARVLIGVSGAAAAFVLAWMLLRILDGGGRRKDRSAFLTNGDGPRLRRRDNHPDAPVCRPISASRDLGEPGSLPLELDASLTAPAAEPAPESRFLEPSPAAFAPPAPEPEPAEPEAAADEPAAPVPAEREPEPAPMAYEPSDPELETLATEAAAAASRPAEDEPEPWFVEPALASCARPLRAARPRIFSAEVEDHSVPPPPQPMPAVEPVSESAARGPESTAQAAPQPAADAAPPAPVPTHAAELEAEPAAPGPERAAQPSWLAPTPAPAPERPVESVVETPWSGAVAEAASEPTPPAPESVVEAAEPPAPAPEQAAAESLPDLMRRFEQGLARRRRRPTFTAGPQAHAPAPQVFPEANDDRLQNAIESLQRFAARAE